MLNVNTIEFNGRKAVINSYSDHPALVNSMNRQREEFAERFPNATIKTERMTYEETVKLVASETRTAPHEIGEASNGNEVNYLG